MLPKGRELYKCICNNSYLVLSAGYLTYWPSDPRKIPDVLDFAVYSGIARNCLQISNCNDLSSDHIPLLVNFNTFLNTHSKHKTQTLNLSTHGSKEILI